MEASPRHDTDALPVQRVGIRELRHDFRAWLDRVQAGERVLVTDRGRPIAELVPHREQRTFLQELVASGEVVLKRASWDGFAPVELPEGGIAIADALEEQRREFDE